MCTSPCHHSRLYSLVILTHCAAHISILLTRSLLLMHYANTTHCQIPLTRRIHTFLLVIHSLTYYRAYARTIDKSDLHHSIHSHSTMKIKLQHNTSSEHLRQQSILPHFLRRRFKVHLHLARARSYLSTSISISILDLYHPTASPQRPYPINPPPWRPTPPFRRGRSPSRTPSGAPSSISSTPEICISRPHTQDTRPWTSTRSLL